MKASWSTRRVDVVPVVFGSGKPYYFSAVHAQHLLEDPDVVIPANRVLHRHYRLCRLDVLDGVVRYCRADPGLILLVATTLQEWTGQRRGRCFWPHSC